MASHYWKNEEVEDPFKCMNDLNFAQFQSI